MANNYKVNLKLFGINEHNINQIILNKLKNYQQKIPKFKGKDLEFLLNKEFCILGEPKHKRFKINANENFKIYMLSLAPYTSSGENLCAFAGDCKNFCLGMGVLNDIDKEEFYVSDPYAIFFKILKTMAFFHDKEKFFIELSKSLSKIITSSENKNIAIRLNGYSDVIWEKEKFTLDENLLKKLRMDLNNLDSTKDKYNNHLTKNVVSNEVKENYNIFELFSGIQFYDYTKYLPFKRITSINNYHLVFSYDKHIANNISSFNKEYDLTIIVEKNSKEEILKKSLCEEFNIIDGDLYDFRFLDKFKFEKKNKEIGFIILLEATNLNGFKNQIINSSNYVIKDINTDIFEIIRK